MRDRLELDLGSGALAADGVTVNHLSLGEVGNRVLVGVSIPDVLTEQRLRQKYGAHVALVQRDPVSVHRRIPPLVGGLRIESPVRGSRNRFSLCSSAFSARVVGSRGGRKASRRIPPFD